MVPLNSPQTAPLHFYATRVGEPALDSDRMGGNPFASAFLDALPLLDVSLHAFSMRLGDATSKYSDQFQTAEIPEIPASLSASAGRLTRRVALVAVNSSYATDDLPPLPGAKFDGARISAALSAAGFHVIYAFDFDKKDIYKRLAVFRQISQSSDLSLAYVTGHGEFINNKDNIILISQSVKYHHCGVQKLSIDSFDEHLSSRILNIICWAGCRTSNPST